MYHKVLRAVQKPPGCRFAPPAGPHGPPRRELRPDQRARAATPKNSFTSRSALAVLSEAWTEFICLERP